MCDNSHVLTGQGNLVNSPGATILGGNLNTIASCCNTLTYSVYCTNSGTGTIYINGNYTGDLTNGNVFYYYHTCDNRVYKGNITSSTYSGYYTELQGICAGTSSSDYTCGVNYSTVSSIYSCGSLIVGGNNNTISGEYDNTNDYKYNTIVGGQFNTISSYYCGTHNTISGGYRNRINGDCGTHNTISGGFCNTISSYYGCSFIGGGSRNTASGCYTTVSGGYSNTASGNRSTVSGGRLNTSSGYLSTLGGGLQNTASGQASTVSGGRDNTASGSYSFIAGGVSNNTNNQACSFIVGSNITADRSCATFVNNLSIINIPTSSAGLPSGAIWKDTGAGNVLKIV